MLLAKSNIDGEKKVCARKDVIEIEKLCAAVMNGRGLY